MKDTSKDEYYRHVRYGRVGKIASNENNGISSLKEGITAFEKTHKQKNKKGYYDLEIALGKPKEEEPEAKKAKFEPKKFMKSKLDDKTQDLMNFIFDKK